MPAPIWPVAALGRQSTRGGQARVSISARWARPPASGRARRRRVCNHATSRCRAEEASIPPSDRDDQAGGERGQPGAHLRRPLLPAQVGVLSWVAFCFLSALAAGALSAACVHTADAVRCQRVLRLEWYGLVAVEAAVLLGTLLGSSANRNRRRRVHALVAGAIAAPLPLIAYLLLPLPGG
jgi:hypothetical protein